MISNLAMLFASLAFGKHTTSQGMSIRQICASAFGNGIQGDSGVSDVINSYSICLFSPFILCIILGLFWAETFKAEPVFSCRFKPLSMQAGQSNASACILCYSYFSTVQPVLPDVVPAPGFSGSVLFPLVRSLRRGFSFLPQFMAPLRLGSISHQPGHCDKVSCRSLE